jgi:poly(A) polymerase/tRNA nucleotidyltransferase (CCA-adding enzyme)
MLNLDYQNLIQKIPKYVLVISEVLETNNFEAHLVGGSVRDILIGKQPQDYDIATNAYPEDIQKLFPKSIAVGAKFGTIVVVIEDENGERFDVEVTTYRSEADYVGGRWPSKVEFSKTIHEDLSRRDFTMNAIAINLQLMAKSRENNDPISALDIVKTERNIQEVLIDPFDGIKDIESGIIRAVRDPLERFTEDGLRPVRACRLASQLSFEIEQETFEAAKATNHITKLISVERFKEEFVKILLKSPKPSVGIRLIDEAGILQIFIPELLEGKNVNQPQFHIEDVFSHSLHACDVAEDSIKLAALLHDVGKPRTKSEDGKGVHFYGHDQLGADMVVEIMKRLHFSNDEIDRTEKLVRWHMFFYPSGDWRKTNLGSNSVAPSDDFLDPVIKGKNDNEKFGWTDGAIRRMIIKLGGEQNFTDLMKLRIADATSNPKSPFNPKEIDVLAKRVSDVLAQESAFKISDMNISGQDLMKEFSLEPGKQIGEVLKFLFEKVIDEPILNEKSKLLEMAKDYLSQ